MLKVKIFKATPTIDVEDAEVIYSIDGVNITVKSDISGTYVIKIDGKSQEINLAANVSKNITFVGLKVSDDAYAINVSCADLENCTEAFNDTAKIKVNKATPSIAVSAGEVIIRVVLLLMLLQMLGEYCIRIGNKTRNIVLDAGVKQSVTFDNLSANEDSYVVNVTYDATENYTAAFNDSVVVSVLKATPSIEVSAVDVTYPGDVVVSVVSDVSGDYVVKVADQVSDVVLIAGVAEDVTFIGLAAKEDGYVVNVTYDATENYTEVFNDKTLVKVLKAAPIIEVASADVTYPNILLSV